MQQKIIRDAAIVVARVAHYFRDWARAAIEIAREAGVSGEMRRLRPLLVIAYGVCVGVGKPGESIRWRRVWSRVGSRVWSRVGRRAAVPRLRGDAFGIVSFFGLIHGEDHRAQERRLRASEVVRAVGVQDAAIVCDLEKEIFDHAFRECQVRRIGGSLIRAPIGKQTTNDEVAVPAVHFIELAARHHIRIGEVEKAVGAEAGGIDYAGLGDSGRQVFHGDGAMFL